MRQKLGCFRLWQQGRRPAVATANRKKRKIQGEKLGKINEPYYTLENVKYVPLHRARQRFLAGILWPSSIHRRSTYPTNPVSD